MDGPAILDTDTLSELARGNPLVTRGTAEYLATFGRLTTTAVTVFERLRGYRLALRDGRPFEQQLRSFEAFVSTCFILPFDQDAARVASRIWSAVGHSRRHEWEDILIAAIAISRGLPLVTRNRRDFERLAKDTGIDLALSDWTRPRSD